ncbi:MAG: APC family permease, partial [Verrucomicrobiales bacterium]|nr:APC family permease [Verrucomicrobiales bacterium]
FAVSVIVIISMIHLGRISRIAGFQCSFTSAKLILIVVLGILGFALGSKQDISFLPRPGDSDLIFSADFGISFVYVLYAYAGWNAATYMIDEVRNPAKTVPVAILTGTALVTVVYLFVNAAFLYSTPVSDLAGEAEAGLIASKAILGERGGNAMGLIIAFGLISTISSMTWAGPRVTAVIGQDYPVFRRFAQLNKNGVPATAVIFQSLIAVILILTATFDELIHYIQALLTISSIGVVVGMVWLRIRQPGLKRPFKAWGYPVTPLLFLICTFGVLYFQVQQKTTECLWGVVTLLIGAVIHRFASRTAKEEGL